MDCGAFYRTVPVIKALPAAVKLEGNRSLLPKFGSLATSRRIGRLCFQGAFKCDNLRSPVFVSSANANSRKHDYWSVATPLELRSSAGKFLSGILKNQRHIFPFAVVEQLEELAADKNGAIARKRNTVDSAESFLHGRIAEIKEQECEIAIEEVMYMLIVHKFAEIEAPMVPRLSSCIRNGKLETLASKDRQLESIHDLEVLEMVREHFTTILIQRGNSSIPYNWMTTQMTRLDLGRLYGASIMYGYFLKSACLRHHLEANLAQTDENLPLSCRVRLHLLEGCTHGSENVGLLDRPDTLPHLYRASMMRQHDNKLRGFVMGFDAATLQRCAKLKSQEAVNLIEKHTWALFGDDDEIGAIGEVVAVTDSSLKRLVLEAVAFGSFLWDAEGYVDSLCKLKET